MKYKKITALLGTALILAAAPVCIVKTASAATDYSTTDSSTNNTTGTNTGMNNKNLPDLRALDTDNSGTVSRNEFTASGQFDNTLFDRIDTNRDGIISQSELDAYKRANGQTGSSTTTTP